jgi:hypothetical protein
MNLKEDKDLLYIAKEGLKAPLPYPWKVIQIKKILNKNQYNK